MGWNLFNRCKCRIVQGHKCIKWFKCSLKAKANQVLELFSLSLYHGRVSLAKLAKGVCTPAFDGVVFIQQHTSDVSYRARDLHADRRTLAGKWLEDAAMFVPSNYAVQPWNLSNSMYPIIALEMGTNWQVYQLHYACGVCSFRMFQNELAGQLQ